MEHPNHIYQYSLLSALMSGVSSDGIPASKLSPATQGIGTFVLMDGELVLLDHKVYQLRADGSVRQANADDQIPFAMVTRLEPTTVFSTALPSKEALHNVLMEKFPHTENVFVAYRVEARWKSLKMRTVRGQAYAGQPLSELGQNQHVFESEDVDGTIVGFRSPESWQGISVAGEHMHFLSDNRKFGGHVLTLSSETARVSAAVIVNVHVELPTSAEFNNANLAVDDAGIRKAES